MFEKKRGKRFLASVMALVMLLSLAPVGTLAADETPTNEECSAMPLPAVEGKDQQAVVTDEQNTENTNEETTPPPAMRVTQEHLLITTILPRRFPKCP